MTTELILVRHGKTESNERGLLHGRTDIPLAPLGAQQARRVAQRLREMGSIGALYTSPLERAFMTAQEISNQIEIEPRINPDLSEFDFGDLEGLTFEELQVQHPDLYLSLINPTEVELRFPNGESRSTLERRVSSSLEQITANNGDSRIVVVAHQIVIAAAVTYLTSGNPNDAIRYLVRNCSVTHLEVREGAPADIWELDDVSHLE